jgi:sigma-E factor negative regulatory protein RseB
MAVRAARARTWRQVWQGLCLGILLLAGAASAHAAGEDPLAYLQQVQQAARSLDYEGVMVYQQGASLQSSRLVHLVDATGERERLTVLDGEPRECLRQQGIEQCLQPAHKLIVTQPARSDHFPALLLGNEGAIARHYEWRTLPHTYRIAGRECAVSELRARDALRYSYRICTDRQNHLLLKSQTLDARGHLVDQVAFSSIRFGAEVSPSALSPSWDTRGWQSLTQDSRATDLAARGWRFSLPAGFHPVAELSRQIAPGHVVDQLVLSDGLAAISVFIETFDPKHDQSVKEGGMQQGAINVYRMRVASYWLTAVGEVPAQTVRDLARAVQHVAPAAR